MHLQALYRAYSVKQRRPFLKCFIAASILYDLYCLIVPLEQDLVNRGVTTIFLAANICLLLVSLRARRRKLRTRKMTAEVETVKPPRKKKLKVGTNTNSLEINDEALVNPSNDTEAAEKSNEVSSPSFKSNVFVSDSLKSNLTGGNSGFSLLSVFDSKGGKVSRRNEGDTANHPKTNRLKSTFAWSHADTGTPLAAQTWWKEPLFFTGADDKRLEEGAAFIRNKANDGDSEEFKNTRREMKTLVRKKIKRTDKRKDKTARFHANKRKTPNHVIKKRNIKKLKK